MKTQFIKLEILIFHFIRNTCSLIQLSYQQFKQSAGQELQYIPTSEWDFHTRQSLEWDCRLKQVIDEKAKRRKTRLD